MIAAAAVALSVPPAIILARVFHHRRFPGLHFLETLFLLPLVVPPVMTGLALLLLLGRNGPLGFARLLFTPWAAIIAAAVVAFPMAYQSARASFQLIDSQLEEVAASLGASRTRILFSVTLPLAWPGLLGGTILAFARALGEFGATIMVLGNNPESGNLTVPVAIYNAAEYGNFRLAGLYSLGLGILNLIFLGLVQSKFLRGRR